MTGTRRISNFLRRPLRVHITVQDHIDGLACRQLLWRGQRDGSGGNAAPLRLDVAERGAIHNARIQVSPVDKRKRAEFRQIRFRK